MTAGKTNKYDQRNIDTMEMLYGKGYLSMGGDDEVAKIVETIDVTGKNVLDIGCGLGGALIAFAKNHAAGQVTGIDVDAGVLERARELVDAEGLQDKIRLTRFDPGPLPLEDDSFDLVFLTAVSCHIEDLVPFFAEIRRVIRPGGHLVGGEWFKRCDNAAYQEWDELLRARGLNFYFVTTDEFESALSSAGFTQTSVVDRCSAMAGLAEGYLARVEHEMRTRLIESLGEDGYADLLNWTRIRASGLGQGGAGYGHFIAGKSVMEA